VKAFDVLIVLISILLVTNSETFVFIKRFIIKFRRVFLYIFFLIIFIIFAQFLSYFLGYNLDINFETIKNHGRLIFNFYTLLVISFLIFHNKKLLIPVSWAIIISPIIVLPVYWNFNEGFFINGGRLTGFLQTPIIFGIWMTIVFLVGLGIFHTLKNNWQKFLLILWLIIIANFILWGASRASWISLVIAIIIFMLFYFLKNEKRKSLAIFLIFITTFLIGYFILPSKDLEMQAWVLDRAKNLATNSVFLRPESIQGQNHTTTIPNAFSFVYHNYLGSGFGEYAAINLSILNHGSPLSNNSYLELALYGGVGALLMFLFFLFGVGKEIKKTILSGKLSDLEIAWIIAGIAFMVDVSFTDGFLWRHTWFVLGIVIGII